MEPFVSIVIPAFHARQFIHRAVRSVLAQSWSNLEIVIASDDGFDYARTLNEGGILDPRIRCVFTGGVETGAARARNTALDAAHGRVIATLDADDRLAPDALAVLVPLALRGGSSYCRPMLIDDATNAELPSSDRSTGAGPKGLEEILTGQIHTFAGIVFDREVVSARWMESLRRWEDVHFYARCFDDVEAIHHVPEPLYFYHRTEGSVCNRPASAAEYLTSAVEIIGRLQRGEKLGFENESSRLLFWRFLNSRRAIEAAFVESMADGECRDYLSFVRQNRSLFDTLGE